MKLKTINTDKDYNKLQHLPFNRNFSVRQDLIQSMNHLGFIVPAVLLHTDILIGKPEYYILDGQHRLLTARFLNIPANCIVIEPKNINTVEDIVQLVSAMNSKSKPWKTLNYAEAFNYLNYEDYKTLLKITNSSPYSVDTVAMMLYGIRSKSGNASKAIKNGTFKVNYLESTKATLHYAAELSKHGKILSRMIIALHNVMGMRSFNKEDFTKKYIQNYQSIRELNLDDYNNIFVSWIK